ncbi:MAG: hypothetical protein Q4D51_12565 [Eubacteriales bacterium]|nr:hypothetical protein [Eubacteriales bacterium]
MDTAINDATLKQAGNIYQYLVALRDCYKLKEGEILQIEKNGDVSIVNNERGIFQKEVKHHFGNKSLSDRDEEFWKTLANWYSEYERVKTFSEFILSTTASVSDSSSFCDWNKISKQEKLDRIKKIGDEKKEREDGFRKQYNRIFNDSYDEKQLLDIIDKFIIENMRTSLSGISKEFEQYVRHIPNQNRDGYIGALLGEILIKVKDPPHKWEVTKDEFDEILQRVSPAYMRDDVIPLPNSYAMVKVPDEEVSELEQKKFVKAIREIKHEVMITDAISDYWKTDITIAEYFQDNFMYLHSLEQYRNNLEKKMRYAKSNCQIEAEDVDENEQIKISKHLYNDIMLWNADDFGSIIRNQDFFQHGVIHNIVDDTEFNWKVGDENEH